MRLIAWSTLAEFAERNPQSKAALTHWRSVVKEALWTNVNEVQSSFSKAKALNGERVRFEIAGGDFRLIVAFDFKRSIAFVKFIGTHADYDKIDALTVNLF
ncbi:MAG TPA: type II toxin-antitoxin system HigB family toxin [Sphingomicrobium sp.]|nr:type II toxin-antitoxin system HigB family toxin [Sphingomicrobium sp.]